VALGVASSMRYSEASVEVAPGSSLYVFSDGVFEIELRDGGQWSLEDFAAHLVAPRRPGVPETQRLREAAHAVAKNAAFDDDFSMVVATFE
jgi:sigma-B regulation protein RsbU (phosphoserine phosphatase)